MTATAKRIYLVLLGLALVLGVTVPSAADDPTDEIKNWKELLPDAEFQKLLAESNKVIQEYTRSAGSLNQNSKKLQNEAYTLVVLGEVIRRAGDGAAQKKAVALQHNALLLAEAGKKKNLDDAKKHAAAIADYQKGGAADAKPVGNLAEAVPVHNLMEAVQNCYKKHQEYGRLSATAFNQKGKTEEIASAAYKMAAFSVAITAHVPKDKEGLKDKQPADWLKPTEDMRKATLDIALAAKAKKPADVKAAIRRMDSACTKCHDNFRIDAQ